MFDINGGEMAVITIVALIVLGPQRLPELARKAGEWTRTMRAIALDFRQGLEKELGEIENPIRQIRDDVSRPIREVENELRGVGGELRGAAGEVDRKLTWKGPINPEGPSPADAAEDLQRIDAGEDLLGDIEPLATVPIDDLADLAPGADLVDVAPEPDRNPDTVSTLNDDLANLAPGADLAESDDTDDVSRDDVPQDEGSS